MAINVSGCGIGYDDSDLKERSIQSFRRTTQISLSNRAAVKIRMGEGGYRFFFTNSTEMGDWFAFACSDLGPKVLALVRLRACGRV